MINNQKEAIAFIKSIDAKLGESWCEDDYALADAFVEYAEKVKKEFSALISTSDKLKDYLVENPRSDLFDIPNEIWIPFETALNKLT